MNLIFSLILSFLSINAFAVETLSFKEVEQSFKTSGFPLFDYYIESAIPGRCIHKFAAKKIEPSVILVSLGEKGFEIAPIALSTQSADYFDNMSWRDVFNHHPEVNAQFLELVTFESTGGVGLYKKELLGESIAEIRENNKFFIIKVFKNKRFFRYCYYQK